EVELVREGAGYRARGGGGEHRLEVAARDGGLSAVVDGERLAVDLHRDGDRLSLWRGAARLDLEIVDPRHVDARASVHEGELVARLPGTVVAVAVAEGDTVEAGATLMVLEAMKMEHAIVAPAAGRVARLHFKRGDRVPEGAPLVEFQAAPAAAE
ncbi:MAG: biotin/lipoyl-binding protein, partial [Proteobacteria bacterium]|nr:biotin/lipoyl-binding protein [Pseudomonadota bacterium]